MSTYYPSLVVNLRLLFDENALPQPRTGTPIDPTVLSRARVNGYVTAAEPAYLQRASEVSYIFNVIPRKASVELPGYRQAATFSVDVDFKDLPLDPRTVRSCAIEVHLGTVTPKNFSEGMRGAEAGRSRRSILRTRNADRSVNEDTLLMVGTVDEWDVTHSDSGSEVSLRGRDLRGILLDSPLAVASLMEVDSRAPITEVVASILSFHPFGSQITLEANAAEWPGSTIPSPTATDLVLRHRRGARGSRARGRASMPRPPQDLTYWDAIVRYCYLVGAIPYFDGSRLRIRPSRSIFEQQRAGFDPSNQTPFAGGRQRQVGNGAPFSVRRMVFGRNIAEVTIKRKLAGNSKPKAVRVVSVDMDAAAEGGSLLEAVYPPPTEPSARANSASAGANRAQTEYLNVPVYGVRDVSRLADIARNVFEEIGRNEVGGSASTPALASFGGDNEDADLLRLRPGDGVEFIADLSNSGSRPSIVSSALDTLRNSEDESINALAERIGDQQLARAIVASSRAGASQLPRFFRVATVRYDWDADKGVGVSFDYQNYIVSRYNPNELSATEPGAVTRTTSPTREGGLT